MQATAALPGSYSVGRRGCCFTWQLQCFDLDEGPILLLYLAATVFRIGCFDTVLLYLAVSVVIDQTSVLAAIPGSFSKVTTAVVAAIPGSHSTSSRDYPGVYPTPG
jgi:hypothetical protein